MATKLEGLHIKKVDFVDQGANQMANIKIKKSKDGEEISNPEVGLFKRFVNWITGELSKSDSEITKSATTFNEQINAVSMDAIRDEIWSTCYALQNSLNSILCDAEMDSSAKQAAMETSTEQFAEAMKGYIPNWASGTATNIRKNLATPDETDLQMVMKAHKNLTDIIEKSNEDNEKGELEDMLKINKSKMTAEERTAYDELIKKYAVETEEQTEEPVGKSAPKAEDPDIVDDSEVTKTQKSVTPPPAAPTTETSADTGDDIERAEFNAEEMRRGTLVFAKHKTWKEGISGIVYRASAEQITVMYPNSLTNTQNHFFIPVSEVYKNEWEIRYSGDGLRTVQEYKEAADES